MQGVIGYNINATQNFFQLKNAKPVFKFTIMDLV